MWCASGGLFTYVDDNVTSDSFFKEHLHWIWTKYEYICTLHTHCGQVFKKMRLMAVYENLAVFWDYIDVSLRKEKMRYGPIWWEECSFFTWWDFGFNFFLSMYIRIPCKHEVYISLVVNQLLTIPTNPVHGFLYGLVLDY